MLINSDGHVNKIVGWTIYDKVLPTDNLKQGDLVEFSSANDDSYYGIIVTADCDLDKKKHGRLVTLVPLLSLDEIVERYLLIEQLDRYRDSILRYVIKAFEIESDINDPIIHAEIKAKLQIWKDMPGKNVYCLGARAVVNDLDSISASEFKLLMNDAQINVGNMTQKSTNQIKDKGDLVILPKPTFLKKAVEIVWVRQVWQVPLREIVLKSTEIREGHGFRVARLDSPYRYRVTQLMGQVFGDIGTPDVTTDFNADFERIFQR